MLALFKNDKGFDGTDKTCPRTEIRTDRKDHSWSVIADDTSYKFYFQLWIETVSDDFNFNLFQLFGDGPNVMVKYKNNGRGKMEWRIQANSDQYTVPNGPTPASLKGRWSNWIVDFKLAAGRDGYVKVSVDGKPFGTGRVGKTKSGGPSHIKLGIYMQSSGKGNAHVCPLKRDMVIFVRNLQLAKQK
jgi:hypothetical protein